MIEVRAISPSGGHGVIFRDGDGYRGLGTRTYCWVEGGEWDPYRTDDTEAGTATDRARRFILGSDWRFVEPLNHPV